MITFLSLNLTNSDTNDLIRKVLSSSVVHPIIRSFPYDLLPERIVAQSRATGMGVSDKFLARLHSIDEDFSQEGSWALCVSDSADQISVIGIYTKTRFLRALDALLQSS